MSDDPPAKIRVGVLALQGDVAEHEAMLRRSGAEPVRVRRPGDLAGLDALVLPGGESTTIGKLAVDFGLVEPLRDFVRSGRPVWGTCAGLILLARDIAAHGIPAHDLLGHDNLADDIGPGQPLVGGLDVQVERNAFGRQVDSFETDLEIAGLDGGPFHAVFIRAPAIRAVGPGVEVLARVDGGAGADGTGPIVAVRQGSLFGTAFHAELGEDLRWHRFFLGVVPKS